MFTLVDAACIIQLVITKRAEKVLFYTVPACRVLLSFVVFLGWLLGCSFPAAVPAVSGKRRTHNMRVKKTSCISLSIIAEFF